MFFFVFFLFHFFSLLCLSILFKLYLFMFIFCFPFITLSLLFGLFTSLKNHYNGSLVTFELNVLFSFERVQMERLHFYFHLKAGDKCINHRKILIFLFLFLNKLFIKHILLCQVRFCV